MQEGAGIEQDVVIHFGHEVCLRAESSGPAQQGQCLQSEVGVSIQKTPLNQIPLFPGLHNQQLGQSRITSYTHHEEGHDPQAPHLYLPSPGVPDGLASPLIGRSRGNHGDEVRFGTLAHERTGHEQELIGSGGRDALQGSDARVGLRHRAHVHGGDPRLDEVHKEQSQQSSGRYCQREKRQNPKPAASLSKPVLPNPECASEHVRAPVAPSFLSSLPSNLSTPDDGPQPFRPLLSRADGVVPAAGTELVLVCAATRPALWKWDVQLRK